MAIVACLVALVTGARVARGEPKAIEIEPHKVLGKAEAPHFVVVFSDFACPFCNKIRPALKGLLHAYPNALKLVFKHFPLSSHPGGAELAAEASECAADQGKFWPYHDVLFDHAQEWYDSKRLPEHLIRYASELGLERSSFKACLDSRMKKKVVARNQAEGRNVFVSTTPTCLLDGRKVLKSHSPDAMKTVLQKELEP